MSEPEFHDSYCPRCGALQPCTCYHGHKEEIGEPEDLENTYGNDTTKTTV